MSRRNTDARYGRAPAVIAPLILAGLAVASCGMEPSDRGGIRQQADDETAGRGYVQHLQPDGLVQNPVFTPVVVAGGPRRTIYIGGQNAVAASGTIVGRDDIAEQTHQTLRNIERALAAADARLEHVVKWNVYAVAGQPAQPAVEAFQRIWGDRPDPPAITVLYVSSLAHPEFLVEIDAIAVVPE